MSVASHCIDPACQSACFPGLDAPPSLGVVLIVEDESFVRQVAAEILVAAGYEVLTARNATDALTIFLAHQERIALVVLDVVLPGKNGCDLAVELAALRPGLKILLMSGYPENVITKNKVTQGKAMYLAKPFSVEGLMRKVRDAVVAS